MSELKPRSIRPEQSGSLKEASKKQKRNVRERSGRKLKSAQNSVSSSGLAKPGSKRTLTTAQREKRFRKRPVANYGSSGNKETIGLRIKKDSHAHRGLAVASHTHRARYRRNQATKSTGWMPWHHTPTKDVASCEKLRGAASRHRSVDIRMGEPGR